MNSSEASNLCRILLPFSFSRAETLPEKTRLFPSHIGYLCFSCRKQGLFHCRDSPFRGLLGYECWACLKRSPVRISFCSAPGGNSEYCGIVSGGETSQWGKLKSSYMGKEGHGLGACQICNSRCRTRHTFYNPLLHIVYLVITHTCCNWFYASFQSSRRKASIKDQLTLQWIHKTLVTYTCVLKSFLYFGSNLRN